MVSTASARVTVCLDIVPDDDNPSATLSAQDEAGELLAQVRVAPSQTHFTRSPYLMAEIFPALNWTVVMNCP